MKGTESGYFSKELTKMILVRFRVVHLNLELNIYCLGMYVSCYQTFF